MSGFRPSQNFKLVGQDRFGTRTYVPRNPYQYETVVVGKRIKRSPITLHRFKNHWKPKPPSQRKIDISNRIAIRRNQDQARQQAEQARKRERSSKKAREHNKGIDHAQQRKQQSRQTIERAQLQKRDQQHRRLLDITQQRRLKTQRDQQRLRIHEQHRSLQVQMRRTQPVATQRGSTFLGDFLASMVPPRFKYHTLRRPILGAPFAHTGTEALLNLKKREAFAGRFAMENIAFWSTQVSQVVGALISGLGIFGAIGQVAKPLGKLSSGTPITRLPPAIVVEIGAGDLKSSRHLQKLGAKVIAVEPDPGSIPTNALREFNAMGGKWMGSGKTAKDVATKSADHVIQYFPWEIGGSGSYFRGGTWDAAYQGMRIAKKTLTFVTEDTNTASYLAAQALKQTNVDKVAWIKSTVSQAAPGATGAGVRGVHAGGHIAASHPVDMVVVYLKK